MANQCAGYSMREKLAEIDEEKIDLKDELDLEMQSFNARLRHINSSRFNLIEEIKKDISGTIQENIDALLDIVFAHNYSDQKPCSDKNLNNINPLLKDGEPCVRCRLLAIKKDSSLLKHLNLNISVSGNLTRSL